MWTNKYEPSISDWYLVKVNGNKKVFLWNSHNKFFADVSGKTYKFNEIDCWLDDSKIPVNNH